MQNYSMSIQLKNINCFYGQHQALFDINLECGAGETMVLLGPSGAGKSSLLRALNLLEMPRSGELTIADHHLILPPRRLPKRSVPCVRTSVWYSSNITCGRI